MFGAVDDLFLHGFIQLYKVRAVACDADYEVAVLCRMLFCIDEGLFCYYIELDMLSAIC